MSRSGRSTDDIALAYRDGRVDVVSPGSGAKLASIRTGSPHIFDMALSADESHLLIVSSALNEPHSPGLFIWDWSLVHGRPVLFKHLPFATGAFLVQGTTQWLATASRGSGTTFDWVISKLSNQSEVYSVSGQITDLEFSDNDRVLIIHTGTARTGRIQVLALAPQPKMLDEITWPTQDISSIRFSRDGSMIAISDGSAAVKLISTSNPTHSRSVEFAVPVWNVQFTPDGKRLAAITDSGLIYIDNLGRGQETGSMQSLETFRDVQFISFSQDSHWMAVWDGRDKARILQLPP